MENLPKHWEMKQLGEVCNIKNGKNQKAVINANGKYPIYGSAGIMGFADDYLCEPGATIIGRKGTINKPIYVNTKFWNVDTAFGFCPDFGQINGRFLFFFCQSFNFHKLDKSTTIPSLAKTDLQKINIPIPPLPEQSAIVSKIEELFSELDHAKGQLQTALQQLKVYRQSLLNLVVSNENLVPIKTVIGTLDQGWSPKCLNLNSKNEDEWAVIKTSAVQHGYFCEEENKILPTTLKPRLQHEIKKGDILITRAGPRVRVGVCSLVRKVRPKLINCDKVYRIRVNTQLIAPEYFELVLNSPFYQREIEKLKTGINDSGVNLTQNGFLQISIPLRSIEKQKEIVQELENKLTVCDHLEADIRQGLEQAESLRQSILKQAFEGKLITYNPTAP